MRKRGPERTRPVWTEASGHHDCGLEHFTTCQAGVLVSLPKNRRWKRLLGIITIRACVERLLGRQVKRLRR